MDKAKRKNEQTPPGRTWRFFILLTLFLLLMVKFPIRVIIKESLYDSLIWGAIALACVAVAIRMYQRFGKSASRLIGMILLCAGLAGWQVFDLIILRERVSVSVDLWSRYPYDGMTWYSLRFPSQDIFCHTLYEKYIGSEFIAITIEINREATWFACGG